MTTELPLSKTTIRGARPSDAAALADFAARTFSETFEADNSPENMSIHLARTYGPGLQAAEIDDPGMSTIIAESDGRIVGYAQLRAGAPPESVVGSAPIELLRFYVDRAWHGRGLARRLMAAVDEEASRRGASMIWLCVWERNERAKAFYRKCGYSDVGSKVFVLGTDRQTDRVFSRVLS
jgi:ribosomal protein S18 acetylase RimI-like enzyme